MSELTDKVSSLNIKDEDERLKKKRKILYELGADVTLEFGNGEVINVSKTSLALESEYFQNIFFGASAVTKFQIKDFDRETFQIFLDLLFGVKEYSVLDALLIFPVAHEYQVEGCIEKCVSVLKPTQMNENVCLTLNLAVFYKCNRLIDDIIAFLKPEGIITLIEDPNYCRVLEPKALLELMEHINLNFRVWNLIYEWGINYLKSKSSDKDIRTFFSENDILEKLSLSHFDSVQCVIDFHKLTDRKLLDPNDVINYVDANLGKSETEKPDEIVGSVYRGMNVIKGKKFTETIIIKKFNYSASKVLELKTPHILVLHFNDFRFSWKREDPFFIDCVLVIFLQNSEPRESFRDIPFSDSPINYAEYDAWKGISKSDNGSSQFMFVIKAKITLSQEFYGLSDHHVRLPRQVTRIKSVEITYSFPFDCFIYKENTSKVSKNIVGGEEDQFYFIKDVHFSATDYNKNVTCVYNLVEYEICRSNHGIKWLCFFKNKAHSVE